MGMGLARYAVCLATTAYLGSTPSPNILVEFCFGLPPFQATRLSPGSFARGSILQEFAIASKVRMLQEPRNCHVDAQRSPSLSMSTSILTGAVLALIASSIYSLYQYHSLRIQLDQLTVSQLELKSELARTREQLRTDISRVHDDTSAALSETSKAATDSLRKQLEIARLQVNASVGEARVAATKHADAIASRLMKVQEDHALKVSEVKDVVSQVRTDTDLTKNRVGEVSSEVGTVKSQLATTKSDLDTTKTELKRVQGDLGVQSGLIATNAKELSSLKERGERIYTEFTLQKSKTPSVVAGIRLRLKGADPKNKRYTMEVTTDDIVVDKKDKTINEPVQFKLSRSPALFELVVNEIAKDRVFGYLSAPKSTPERN